MKFNITYLIFFIIGMSGCINSNNPERIDDLVKEWNGKKIILPDSMLDVRFVERINLNDADFTILSYIDGEGCLGCKLQLQLWNDFLNDIDSISDANVETLFIVNSRDKRELKYLLRSEDFKEKVFLDINNEFQNLNSIPESPLVHTLLLDKNFNVIAIGNPISSESVEDLYKSIICGKQIVNANLDSLIKMKQNQYNLGSISKGENISFGLTIYNIGKDTVYIENVDPSCDCLKIDLNSRRILPKDS